MTDRRKFLALLGFGAGAAVAGAASVASEPPLKTVGFDDYNHRRYIGTHSGIDVYEVDEILVSRHGLVPSILEAQQAQREINRRRSDALFYSGQQWTPEQVSSVKRARLKAGTPIARGWRFI